MTADLQPLPAEIERVLRPYQVQPARQLFRALTHGADEWGYPGAVDLSDLGTGKTFLDLAASLATRRNVGVLCPPAGRSGWESAFRAFDATPAFIESWEAVRGGFRPSVARLTSDGFKWADNNLVLICDESHKAKNDQSLTAFAVEGIFKSRIPCICASATLATSPLELYIAGCVTGLHDGTDDGWYDFLLDNGCQWKEGEQRWCFRDDDDRLLLNPSGSHLARLHSLLIPQRGCRVRKSDMGDQPGTTISLLPLDVPEAGSIRADWKKSVELLKELAQRGTNKEAVKVHERNLRIRTLQRCEMAMVESVAERAKRDLSEDKSVVMFFSYTASRMRMAKLLNRYEGLYGGQSAAQRKRTVENFQANRIHCLLNNVGSGGASVSLHDIHGGRERVSYIFPTMKAVDAGQAPGRIDRYGGKSHSQQWLPVIPGTLSEWVMRRTAEKLQQMSRLNDGVEVFA